MYIHYWYVPSNVYASVILQDFFLGCQKNTHMLPNKNNSILLCCKMTKILFNVFRERRFSFIIHKSYLPKFHIYSNDNTTCGGGFCDTGKQVYWEKNPAKQKTFLGCNTQCLLSNLINWLTWSRRGFDENSPFGRCVWIRWSKRKYQNRTSPTFCYKKKVEWRKDFLYKLQRKFLKCLNCNTNQHFVKFPRNFLLTRYLTLHFEFLWNFYWIFFSRKFVSEQFFQPFEIFCVPLEIVCYIKGICLI